MMIQAHIVKLPNGKYRLLSKKGGKNLGTFDTLEEAKKHERQVEYFKTQAKAPMERINIREQIFRQPTLIAEEELTRLALLKADADSQDVESSEPVIKTLDDIAFTYGGTGVIRIEGILMNGMVPDDDSEYTDISLVSTAIENFASDPLVNNVWLYVNSPGGFISGIGPLATLISQVDSQKPVRAYVGGGSLSAAYWLTSQARNIYGNADSQYGSIGDFRLVVDRTKQLEQQGVEIKVFSRGEGKLDGVSFLKLSDEGAAHIQASIDKAYDKFTGAILNKRPQISLDTVQARVWDSEDSIANGLTDGEFDKFSQAVNFFF